MFLLFSLLTGCATSADPTSPSQTPPSGSVAAGHRVDVGITDLDKALATRPLLIDVRTDGEWATGHVPGAIHVPLDQITPTSGPLATHDRATPVYLICESGGRSGRAADMLTKAGFQTINIKGGTGAWRAAGMPLTVP